MSARTIHLIFKTHLDIGFTNLAQRVRQQYHRHFIPQALETGEHFYFEEIPDRDIDEKAPPEEVPLILDADSSQRACIAAAHVSMTLAACPERLALSSWSARIRRAPSTCPVLSVTTVNTPPARPPGTGIGL